MLTGAVRGLAGLLLVLVASWGCGNEVSSAAGKQEAPPSTDEGAGAGGASAPEALRFRVGDESVLLVWYDDQGAPHPVDEVGAIPEAHRGQVRVDVLSDEGSHRAPEGSLYVADLSAADGAREFVAHVVSREDFDAQLRARAPLPVKPTHGVPAGEASVVLYGTSWCGACKQARAFLKQRGVPFQDRDIEKDPGARSEMVRKAKQAGLRTQGVPVIDVNGTLLQGYDPGRLVSLLQTPAAGAGP